jgi:D-aspartate ligase
MSTIDANTPVVLLRSARHGGLGIVRSLGRLGAEVHVVDPDAWTPALHSRYCRGRHIRDIESEPEAASIQFLRELRQKLGRRPLLIPSTDAGAMFVDEHAALLREWYIFPERPEGLSRSLASKKQMYFLARQCGVPTAETAFPLCRRDVIEYLERARFPIMLKGIYGKKLKLRAGKPMFLVQSAAELLERYDALEDPAEPNLMLQEYIPGGEDTIWMFNGYFNQASDCLVGFTGQKLRQCPVYTGPTCLGVCRRNEQVNRVTREFMRAVGYRGVLDIGYRYDARDGQYKVLDVNPRIGATFRLFVAENGMDVARALYLDMTGQPVAGGTAPEGRKWIVEDCDMVSSVRYYRDGKLTFREWRRSFQGVRECALWAPDDLMPLACTLLGDARETLARVAAKAAGREHRAAGASWAKA